MRLRHHFSVALLAVGIIVALGAPAQAHHKPSSYCSRTGDWCQAVARIHGERKFVFRSFVHRGDVTICVLAPHDHRDCTNSHFRRAGHGIFQTSVSWHDRFPQYGRGPYTVTWRQSGSRIGRALGFHVR